MYFGIVETLHLLLQNDLKIFIELIDVFFKDIEFLDLCFYRYFCGVYLLIISVLLLLLLLLLLGPDIIFFQEMF